MNALLLPILRAQSEHAEVLDWADMASPLIKYECVGNPVNA